VNLLGKLIAMAAALLLLLVGAGMADWVAQALARVGDYLYALGEQMGGGYRFPRLGQRLDSLAATVVGPLVVALVAVAAFEYLAHVRER
jgi:hypothetical protein